MNRIAALVLVTAIALTGCGKSSKSSSAKTAPPTTTTTAPPLTKAEFIAQADPICAKTTADINAVPEPKTTNAEVEAIRTLAGIIKPALAELSALNGAPADVAVLKQHFIDPNQGSLAAAERFLAAVPSANGDEKKIKALEDTFGKEADAAQKNSEADDAALKAYGFNDCAKTNE